MTIKDDFKVLIIGGGTGGMCSAITLGRLGAKVDLVDIAEDWRPLGAGITITGATLRALKDIGVYDEIAAQGYVGEGIRVLSVEGEFIREIPTPIPAEAGVAGCGGITRPVLHNILSRHVLEVGTDVRLGISVDRLEQDADGVDVTFSDGGTGRYDLVIGADGVSSRTREQIFPGAPKAEYTGQSVWRIFIQRPEGVDQRHFYLGGKNKVGFTPVSDTEMYMFINQRTEKVWRDPQTLPGEMRKLLEGYGGIAGQIRDEITEDTEVNFRPLEAFVLPAPWHVGRVVLVGDAAHPTTPQLASGAGMAVEDAIVVAEELEKVDFDVPRALAAYSARREDRCRLVVNSSVKIGRLEQEQATPEEQTAVVDEALAKLAQPI
ncbi:2-polyprenyl-6-methoxyphenol hydroxylase [Raineyella antarctica]|uniref:2-polyprenyl-6-methoxyphenol hydroxylase n=1 Tax=Raineyella antarctica TaxID=1577474 RepID=A0A1G6H0T1_9ACTN|nr:FAD-dependent oxidoreductase [Raineyella antarctica]SDB87872.1 2-polyprenyl-6-methoxyphenol hydroxylase [Raineyella antarctica]